MRTRRFAPLFVTQFLGAFNDNVFRFALIIFVAFTLAERSAMDVRMLVVLTGGVFILPFFLWSALAGQLADRYEKSCLIRLVKTAEVAIMGLGAVGFWLESYYFLLVVLFLMGTHSTFFGPLKYGVLPQHLREEELTGGNGLIQMGTYVAILTGGMLGGVLAGLEDVGPGAVVACVVAIAVAGRVAAGFIPPAPAREPDLRIDFNPFTSSWRIVAAAARERAVLVIILLISGFWFVGATYLSVVPSLGKELLHANENAVTLLNAAFTVGIGTGSLLCERLSRARIELGLVPLAALGITLASFDVWLAGMSAPPAATLSASAFFGHAPAARLFADLVLIGACGALYIVPLYAALQARAEARQLARMLAALNITNAAFMVVSALFTMLLFRIGVSLQGVFGVVGVLNVVGMLVAMAALPEFTARARALLGLDRA
jgi:MFS family permease